MGADSPLLHSRYLILVDSKAGVRGFYDGFSKEGLGDISRDLETVTVETGLVDTNWSGDASPIDANSDGWPDIYVANDFLVSDVFFINNGNATFSEVGYLAGIARTDWSYSVLLADFDNDGWKDMLVANGYRRDARDVDASNTWTEIVERQGRKFRRGQLRELLNLLPVNRLSNYLFRNNGNLTFSDRTAAFGLTQGSFSNGAAYADLDNDGDLDLVVTNLMDPAFVYRNDSERRKDGNFLRVRLKGPAANPAGIGTKVKIAQDGGIQHQEFHVTRGFHSSVEYALHFGLGDTAKVDWLRVTWPDGRMQEIGPEGANQVITLDYDDARESAGADSRSVADAHMREVTDDVEVAFTHRENDYDDYVKEVLLPHKMSQFGPGIAVGDVNGDDPDDFYVGGAIDEVKRVNQDG